MPFAAASRVADLPLGALAAVKIDAVDYALCNVEGTVYCVENACPHAGGPLADGALHGETIVCPWHGWEFDVRTGEGPCGTLQRFTVAISNGQIFIQVP